VHRRSPRRILATALATAALIAVTAAPAVGAPPTGTSKGITIVAQGLTGLGSFTISGGQVIPIQITVTNEGKSVVNDVNLAVGKDNSPTTAARSAPCGRAAALRPSISRSRRPRSPKLWRTS
jgi:hypothetical protein